MRFARPLALATVAATALLLAGCESAPPPKPAPPPPPSATRVAPPPAGPIDWADLPLTPGGWAYDPQTATARFGSDFTIRCDKGARTVTLARTGATGPLTIRTSYGTRTVTAPLTASDPLLDQFVFSRGHVSIESPGTAMVVMPAWAEPGRVVEDCRG